MYKKIFLVTIVSYSPSIFAEYDCSNVIKLSKITTSTVEKKDEFIQHVKNFCNEYAKGSLSAKSSSYGASYGAISASMGSSKTKAENVASKYCSATNLGEASKHAYTKYIDSIAPGAYTAYGQCITMFKNDVQFEIAGILPKEFSLTMKYASKVRGVAATLSYDQSEGISCKWNKINKGNPKTQVIETGSSTVLHCTRKDFSKDSYVTIIREDGPETITIPWRGYDSNGVPVDYMTLISNTNNQLLKENKILKSRMKKLENFSFSSQYGEGKLKYAKIVNDTHAVYKAAFNVTVNNASNALLIVNTSTNSLSEKVHENTKHPFLDSNTDIIIDGKPCSFDSAQIFSTKAGYWLKSSNTCIISVSKGIHKIDIKEYISQEKTPNLKRYSWSIIPLSPEK